MEKEEYIKIAEGLLDKIPFPDKLLAAAAVSGDNSFLYMGEDSLDQEQRARLDLLLVQHMLIAGPHSIKMATLAGRAIKASIENPIKPKTGLIQRLKDKTKELLR